MKKKQKKRNETSIEQSKNKSFLSHPNIIINLLPLIEKNTKQNQSSKH